MRSWTDGTDPDGQDADGVVEEREELGGTPESAVTRAMARGAEKYGPQDWATWEFRAEPVPKTAGADVVRFRYEAGVLVRLG